MTRLNPAERLEKAKANYLARVATSPETKRLALESFKGEVDAISLMTDVDWLSFEHDLINFREWIELLEDELEEEEG